MSYTEDLFLLLERVYKKYEQFSKVINSAKPVVLHQFTLECIVDEVKSTNDIEDVRCTRREIQEILNGTNKSARLEGVVKKYNSLNSGEKFNFTTCADIRKFYDDFVYAEVLSDNKKNKLDGMLFRKEPVDIDSSTRQGASLRASSERKNCRRTDNRAGDS